MATIANLAVKISLDDSGFTRGLENTRKKLDSWGSSMRDFGGKMTAGVTAPLIAGGIMLTKWSANLEQTMGATEHLWGSNADSIIAWSKSADKALGMSQDEALTTANRLNGIFTGMGMSMDQAQVKTMELSARFSDLSALMGGSPTEAAEAYTSALMGNYQALDKYNININAAMVEQRALTMTGKESVAQLTAEEKQLAFNALYLEKTADAEGQFGRELKTTSGRLAVNTARAKNAANAFGRLLLPYVNKLLEGFSKMVDWLESLSDTQRKWALGIAAVAAAMGPLLMVVGMLLPGISALIAVIGFLVSPVGLVVVAVAALVAGLIYAYTHFEGFRDVVNSVASTLKGAFINALDMVVNAFNKLKDAFDAGGWSGMFATLGGMLLNGLQQLSNLALQGVQWLAQTFLDGAVSAASAAWSWIQGVADGALGKWNEFTAWLGGLAATALEKLGDWTQTLLQKGRDLIGGIHQGAVNVWANVETYLSTLGTLAFTAVGNLITTLLTRGNDIITGFFDGVKATWPTVTTFFGNIKTFAFDAVGNLLETLKSRGTDIISGFFTGIKNKWVDVSAFAGNIGTFVLNAVGNLANTLWSAGWDLMWGLAQGIYSGAENLVSAAVGSVADLIPGWIKGPLGINSPSRVFMKIGREIPAGLAVGIEDGVSLVDRAMAEMIPGMAATGSPAVGTGSGSTPVVHIYQVTPQALIELMADAKAGSVFARQFGTELAMMEGVG